MTFDVPEMKLLMSVDKRFFRKAARKSTSKWASREYTSHAFSLMWSVFRGHAQKDVFKAAMFEQKKIEKTTSDVPEMKLFKLFIIGLKKMQWWSGIVLVTLYFFCWEASPLQHNLTYLKFISAGLIDKKNKQTNKQRSWRYISRLLNFIFHQLLIT